MLAQLWRWVLSKRLPDTPKYRKYCSIIYAGAMWQLCILAYIFTFKEKGMETTEAQKTALLKYHERDNVRSIVIDGFSKVKDTVISNEGNQQPDVAP